MKKILFTLFCALFTGSSYAVPSTCEIRMDRNPDKSTAERVEYCLNPSAEPQPEPAAVTRVTYTQVENTRPLAKKQKSAYMNTSKVPVKKYKTKRSNTMTYENAKRYPEYRNNVISTFDEQVAHEASADAAGQLICNEDGMCTAPNRVLLSSRDVQTMDRPTYRLKSDSSTEEPVVQGVADGASSAVSTKTVKPKKRLSQEEKGFLSDDLLDSEGYESSAAPQAEIATAKRLENNLLSQPPANTDDSFLSDDLLTREGFGYNATDPSQAQ